MRQELSKVIRNENDIEFVIEWLKRAIQEKKDNPNWSLDNPHVKITVM